MKTLQLLCIALLCMVTSYAQTFPCNGDFLFTRQVTPAPNTFISRVNFIPNDINVVNPVTVTPATNTNSTVQYNGFVWTQQWAQGSYTLLRVNAAGAFTAFNVVNMPNTDFNNAGVDKNGIMYILENGTAPIRIFAIDLNPAIPVLVTGFPKTVGGLTAGDAVIWGDITFDPTNNRAYAWYHPTVTPAQPVGLYELTNLTGTTPTIVKQGIVQNYTMGSLFFNDRGQLFGYGSAVLGGVQDRIYAVNKVTGVATQYGLPDIAVSQTDGCECAFRLSLDRQVSTPILNIPKCGVDTFTYTFTPRNYSNGGATNITFSDTLDTRLSYAVNAATLQTQLQAIYGAATTVAVTSFGGGINNVININGLSIPVGQNSFTLPVRVDASLFNSSFTTNEQAYLLGIAVALGGPSEPSNDPSTFNSKDATPITINLSGSKCLPPVASNFINTPMPQGNAATPLPGLVAADPDGVITSYNIATIPTPAQGVLSYCSNGTQPCTGAFISITTGNTTLTPAQAATLRFDPTDNFVGNAPFTFTATDNSGNVSNTATYILPVTAQPPVSNNIMENSMINTNGPTTILALNSADVDGTISTYQLTTLPTPAQGVLSVPCPPNLLGATCTGGFQNLTAAILSNYPSGIPLTPTQIAALRFDPTAGFVGNSTFNYNAIDNSGNTSNTANYTIPVSATNTLTRPPLANNIQAQPINNSLGATAIPPLRASDLDGNVVSYTITSIPPASQGTLSVACPPTPTGATCTGGFADLTPAVLAANGGNIVLTPAQISTLRFDPAAGFIGIANFTYIATDNTGLLSNTATYAIPVVNTPPTAININTIAPFGGAAASIVPLSGTDADGIVTEYRVKTLPNGATQGVLSVPCGTVANPTLIGATCTGGFANLTPAVLANYPSGIVITPSQAAGIRFDPVDTYSGAVPFTYTSIDNNSLESAVANYTITIANQPPISTDIVITALPNANGPTAIAPLSSTDPDGTIANYTITSIPAPTSGVLSIPCPLTPTGATCTGGFADITDAVLAANPLGITLTAAQMAGMRFDPALNYTGVVNFNYSATDNSGNISNVATYNIPISGVGNLPPIAQNVQSASMPATNGATAIANLVGTDPDGTVSSYNITTVPPANEGILSIACPVTVTGATCVGGFQNLTPAVLAANGGNIPLTPAQISTLRFDPEPNFTGTVNFSYFNTDNSGTISNLASYTLQVTGTPPVSNPVVSASMPTTNGPTAIPALISTDVDGTIASYFIDVLPPASQGILSIPCPVTLIGATCTGGFQNLTAAILANYSGGIPLTPTQMASIRFDPSGNYQGNVLFNYHAQDNSGLTSNSTTYTIPVTGVSPISNDILAPKMLNSNGPTAIPSLLSTDADGTIATYVINSVPAASQGVLSIPCPPTPTGATCTGGFANLTAAVLAANPGGIVLNAAQIAGLRFAPNNTYNGDVVFNYTAYDNNGNISNTAAYVIPVGSSAVLPVGLLQFSGVRAGNNIALKWNTQNEANVQHYEVWYSTTGNNYNKDGIVTANNLSSNNYGYTLVNFTQPIYYIQLRILDKDGTYRLSNIIVVRNNQVNKISVYPNPMSNATTIDLGSNARGNYVIAIHNATGQLYKQIQLTNVQPNTVVPIQGDYAKGMYIIKVQSILLNTTSTVKLIVE